MAEARVPRIMIAEDDEAILELLVTRMRIAGYHTSQERDGLAALESIRRTPPSACILDVNMPKLDGFQVLKRMRADPLTAHVPVLVLTARRAPDDIKTAIRLGAKTIWMQLGVVDQDAAAKARAAGLTVFMDRCPVIEDRRLQLFRH